MVLLVVDAQKLIVTPALYKYDEFVKNTRMLISTARQNGIEVLFVRHDDGEGFLLTKGNDGYEISKYFAPDKDEKIFDKTVNSPFKASGLLEYLKQKDEKTIIVTGLQTDYCIDATVKCGFEHGFEVIVPAYANSTFDNEYMTAEQTYRYYNEFMWNKRYARCISSEETADHMRKGQGA